MLLLIIHINKLYSACGEYAINLKNIGWAAKITIESLKEK